MYVGYISLIILGIIFVLLLGLLILHKVSAVVAFKYYEKKPKLLSCEPSLYDYFGYGSIEDAQRAMEEDLEVYKEKEREYTDKYNNWKNNRPILVKFYDNFPIFAFRILTLFTSGFLIIVAFIVISNVCNGISQINEWKEICQMVEQVVENGSDLENIAVSKLKIEYNTWLSEAVSSLNTWGKWSG